MAKAPMLLVILPAVIISLGGFRTATSQEPKPPAGVAELLEDNGEALLKLLTNPTGDPGEGHVELKIVYSGKSSIKIVPMQRFHSVIPGWKYRIVEKPGPGEYRYLRFAWKSDGCNGIMVQFHDDKDWHIRFTAGIDAFNWGTKFIAKQPPGEWMMVTRDLFQEFGERTIQGMALTCFNGKAGYFDHIYFGRTIEDLDRIDATGLKQGKPIELKAGDLDRLWNEIVGSDASKSYLAFWTLVAGPKQSLPFIRRKLAPPGDVDVKRIQQWINELDHDKFVVREKAFKALQDSLEHATDLLEKAQKPNLSAEASRRISLLLEGRKDIGSEPERLAKAIRVLEYMETPEAAKLLAELANGRQGTRLGDAAQAALERLRTNQKK